MSSGTSPAIAIVAAWSISATPGPVNVAPDDHAAGVVDHELACAFDPLAVHRRARDVAGAVADHLHVDALLPRLRLGEPDRRQLRIGEHDRGHRPMVGPRLHRRPVQDRVGGDARLVLAHVREQRRGR